jgi:hypothetical protein
VSLVRDCACAEQTRRHFRHRCCYFQHRDLQRQGPSVLVLAQAQALALLRMGFCNFPKRMKKCEILREVESKALTR